ncbi:hypothetical protein CEP54_013473 [Fusarium duplospermum]|uniref:Uncharacterized protein n=1 Tax=Fusarium duplospermum TaxID=1325734 RepID=A0A428P2N6_9HYPO|nr:hypothetical protein CEP54_013473 [Fusarium duplospermum]
MAPSDDNSTRSSPWTVLFPHQNDTSALRAIVVPSWVNSPNVRGTMDILQSCLLTLVACIYTALHLNVPEKTAWYQILWPKTQWVALTLFAPEIVLYMAADQLQRAWTLRRKLRDLQSRSDTVDKYFNFDLKYAFFVVMRGVHIDVEEILSLPDLNPNAYHHFANMPSPQTVYINPSGLIHLAKQGHWLYISRKRIDDKSKADYIQKALVLIQILWMVTQCITRYVNDLPLTLLEIHTVVHVICAVFLYACWFQKPLNVQEPEVANPKNFLGEVARMVQQQFYSSWSNELAIFPPWSAERPIPPLRLASDRASMLWYSPERSSAMRQGDIMLSGLALHTSNRELEVTAPFIQRWDAIFREYPYEDCEVLARGADPKFDAPHMEDELELMEQGKTDCQALYLSRLMEFEKPTDRRELPFSHGERNLEVNFHVAIIGLALILPACYGDVHLAAWKWTFPSHFEGLFWKICCLFIVCASPVMFIIDIAFMGLVELIHYQPVTNDLDDKEDAEDGSPKKKSEWDYWDIGFFALTSFNIPVLVMYVIARVYIVLESFLSLRCVPLGVFFSPAWLQMFPHLWCFGYHSVASR